MVTYGSSRPVHDCTPSARSNPSAVNILPGLKSSLIIKPNGPFIASPASKPIDSTKKSPQASTKPKAFQTRRLQKPETSGSNTSAFAAAEEETNPPKKRSLPISSQFDNDTPLTKKASLKKPIDTEKVFRDKDKVCEVEYNLRTNLSKEKTISLSRSSNMLPEPVTPISKEHIYIPAAEGSGTSRQAPVYTQPAQIIRNVSPSNITHDNQGVSPFNIAHFTQDLTSRIIQGISDVSCYAMAPDTQDEPYYPMTQDNQDELCYPITQNTCYPMVPDTQYELCYPITQDNQGVSCYPITQDTQDASYYPISQDTQDVSTSFMNQNTQDPSPYVTQDILDVFDSPIIIQNTEDESPLVLSHPSPVYTSDKENVPPPIRYPPLHEHSSVYNNQSGKENPDSPMHLPNYSPGQSSPVAYTPSSPHRPTSSAEDYLKSELNKILEGFESEMRKIEERNNL
ncbi:hypothetical protein BDF21DRAFT_420916 [Thamnidium elegans]|nr:hypothetical protein BDF21DRAFT_420916 [Thamnidium elegans]